jgi:hypothetical protein
MAVDSRGRIVVGGSHVGFGFARFMPNGRVDRRFGRRGTVVVAGANNKDLLWVGNVVVDRRDRVIGTGGGQLSRHSLHDHFALVRLLG